MDTNVVDLDERRLDTHCKAQNLLRKKMDLSPQIGWVVVTANDTGKIYMLSPDGESERVVTAQEFCAIAPDEIGAWDRIRDVHVNA